MNYCGEIIYLTCKKSIKTLVGLEDTKHRHLLKETGIKPTTGVSIIIIEALLVE